MLKLQEDENYEDEVSGFKMLLLFHNSETGNFGFNFLLKDLEILCLQFCEAGTSYGYPDCGISSSSQWSSPSKILIKGGTVVNAHHQEIADVYVEDGIIVAVKPNLKVYSLVHTPEFNNV